MPQVNLSPRPGKSVGSDSIWAQAECALKAALDTKGWKYALNEADGAFYGVSLPKPLDHHPACNQSSLILNQATMI